MATRHTIGQRVLLRRRELGLTQKELATLCGFPYQVISGLERGRQSVYAERLADLAEKLQVSSDYLLGLSDHPAAGQPGTPRKHPRPRTTTPVG